VGDKGTAFHVKFPVSLVEAASVRE
jgi:hypothetical protein